MKKTNSEKTKKVAVITGLLTVGVIAIVGIALCLYKEEAAAYSTEESETSLQEVEVNTEDLPSVESTEEQGLVISTEAASENSENESTQALQKEPEKTENEKPTAPPETAVSTETGNPAVPPENQEIPAQTTPQPSEQSNTSDSQNGTVENGKIYIDGFGWIDYNGGETDVITGDEIYENGNTVGIME